jgi:hypothetical protein
MYHEDFTHLPPTFAVGQQFSPGTVGNQLLYIFGKIFLEKQNVEIYQSG